MRSRTHVDTLEPKLGKHLESEEQRICRYFTLYISVCIQTDGMTLSFQKCSLIFITLRL